MIKKLQASLLLLCAFCIASCNQSDSGFSPISDPDPISGPISDPAHEEALIGACNKSYNSTNIVKPTGVYSSVLTEGAASNDSINGGLIRVAWAELEPSPGVFAYNAIDERLALLPSGKKWSLGIHAGWSSLDESDPDLINSNGRTTLALHMSPAWLESDLGIETFDMRFRNVTVHMPKYWDVLVQERLENMLQAVAYHYRSDSRLQLVYVPQMTSNGIEGHFNGVPNDTLLSAAGIDPAQADAKQLFEDIWVNAALRVAKSTALAFADKAIAFEVHEVIGRVSIPQRIMDALLQDADFERRAGVAMWWISGNNTYQSDLVQALQLYEGDLYGQVIGNSSQTYRYPNDDYSQVFTQAKALCMRYIEPWNYEFENNTHDDLMDDFNQFSATAFE